jgi:hypothetical protein
MRVGNKLRWLRPETNAGGGGNSLELLAGSCYMKLAALLIAVFGIQLS